MSSTLRAEYATRKGWGFRVVLLRKFDGKWGEYWEDFTCYDGWPSYAYGLDRNALGRLARGQAREMLIEHGCPDGKIVYNGDWLAYTKDLLGV